MKHAHIAVGGTFDRLHIGHKKLLQTTFNLGQKISIGVTTQQLYASKLLQQIIEPYEVRVKNITHYLVSRGVDNKRFTFHPLSDMYGTTIHDKSIEAIVVTKKTIRGARAINRERNKKGMKKLTIHLCPLEKGSDGNIITSERIRAGEIDGEGKRYLHIFQKVNKLVLPEGLRETLRKPLGEICTQLPTTYYALPTIISVGDIVTATLIQQGDTPDLSIIDFISQRNRVDVSLYNSNVRKFFKDAESLTQLNNHSGIISSRVARTIQSSLKKIIKDKQKITLSIKGEEDLLTLPAILAAPLGSVVVYGQWNKGMILVEVTEEKKRYVLSLLKQFTK